MNQIEEQFRKFGVVPVVALKDAKDALFLAEALIKGGLPCAEITFRTAAAEESIRKITENFPDMLVGAGTVLTKEQVEKAVRAGAKFIVSPGFDPEVVEDCQKKKVPVFPGCVTPSEVAQAVKRGLTVIKFFPSEQYGGIAAIKALAAPYSMVEFMPTGGINKKNLREYLSCEKILCCGGSWMVKEELIQNGEFDRISGMAKEAVEIVKSIRT